MEAISETCILSIGHPFPLSQSQAQAQSQHRFLCPHGIRTTSAPLSMHTMQTCSLVLCGHISFNLMRWATSTCPLWNAIANGVQPSILALLTCLHMCSYILMAQLYF